MKFLMFSSIPPRGVKSSFAYCLKWILQKATSKPTLMNHQLQICYKVVSLLFNKIELNFYAIEMG